LAGEINTSMPQYVIQRLSEALKRPSASRCATARFAILGIAYKKDVDDPRESPSFELWKC